MKSLYANSWKAYQRAMDEARITFALDIGANDGGYTQTLVSNGFTVDAFEPVPSVYKKLEVRFAGNPMVTTFCKGVGSKNEILKNVRVLEAWSIAGENETPMKPSPNPDVANEIFDVELVTIDSFLDCAPVGIIKLDVDGYEHKALIGAEQTIRTWKPAILCELGCYVERMGGNPRAFIEFIFSLGYKIVSMDEQAEFTTWAEVAPQYPHHTTFDVLLIPR